MNIKRAGTKALNYLSDGITNTPAAPKNNSLTKMMSFMYQPEEEGAEEKELRFYINVQPIDIKKEFVNLSFKYPDPENPVSGDLLLAVDKYKAVPNKQEAIVKKCQQFTDEMYGVDSIELLPDKLTACEDVFTEENESITSSLTDDISDAVGDLPTGGSGKSLKDTLFSYFSDIFKSESRELKSVNRKKNEDGSITYGIAYRFKDKDGELKVVVPGSFKLEPYNGDKTKMNLYISLPNKENPSKKLELVSKYEDMTNSKKAVEEACWKAFDGQEYDFEKLNEAFGNGEDKIDLEEEFKVDEETTQTENTDTNSSKKLRFTLQKIQSSEGFDYNLKNIYASYTSSIVLADINTLLEDPAFVADIPVDQEVCYDIEVADDGYEIAEITEEAKFVNECREIGYGAILDAAYRFYFDCCHYGWIAYGPQLDNIKNYCCNYKWRAEEIIDAVSKMVLEDKLTLIDPITRISNLCCGEYIQQIDWTTFVDKMKEDIACIISALELYSGNFSEDKQKVMEGWLRTWNIELGYTLSRATF